MRRTLVASLVTVAVVASCAMAYFFVAGLGEGQHTAELGKGQAANYPVTVAFADGLTPGATEPITFVLEPSFATDLKHLDTTITTSTPECKASWFSITSPSSYWRGILEGNGQQQQGLPAHEATNLEQFGAGYTIGMKEEAAVDQGACESAHVTVKAVASP
ncbi:MAG TPA: hypothetical protein VN817_06910 [Solirubrobacteraceae bacterium]|nr:hypothetical protein [Solirubrobacteraceae bacterium]